ncbi:MAG: GNAT family N-acetyltransferase [Burkholderiales bacterium]
MSLRNLEFFFKSQSVAVIGASDRAQSVGATVMANLGSGAYRGRIMPVNPAHRRIHGMLAARSVADLDFTPELAVVCSPPASVPGIISELGTRGCKAAVVLTGGLSSQSLPDGGTLTQAMLDAARPHLLRILGPNCLGLLVPAIGLNASFSHTDALPGKLAFLSQSGALATTVLDWGKSHGIGFSCFVSLGDSADVDFGDLLDYLGSDPGTDAILMYMESIKAARKFMSAARAAARAKVVIAVKAGRAAEGARAAASHTGALAGSDDIVDAALRRAGILRVATTDDLFNAAETLTRAKRVTGKRLLIVTNGGGAAVLATDAVVAGGGTLAALSPDARSRLDQFLPSTWSGANPVDIIGDAPVARYARALEIAAGEFACDAVLLIHAPTAIVSSESIARACLPIIKASEKPVLTVWLGEDAVRSSRALFSENGIPTYESPEQAVRAFLQLAEYRSAQELLMQAPPSRERERRPDYDAARDIIRESLAANATWLDEPRSKRLLSAYGIRVARTEMVRDANQAVVSARGIGYPVALKILSPDITHKSDVGGVALHLDDEDDVRAAARDMLKRVKTRAPTAVISGFTVQEMVDYTHARELIVGCALDPLFGPAVMFGHGGVAVEVIGDRAFALPPMNTAVARDLIGRTRVAKLLATYRDVPAADENALVECLVAVSQIICEHPEIEELDINPLLASDRGVIALDARIRIRPTTLTGEQRLAIRPYPRHLEETVQVGALALLLRPIRPEDGAAHREFLGRLAPQDTYFRFFHMVKSWPHAQLARLTQIDYDREMAFVAVCSLDGQPEILGVARAVTDPDNLRAEFAIVIRSDLKGRGMGHCLLQKLIRYTRERGTRQLVGEAMADNHAMLSLARVCGFQTRTAVAGIVELFLETGPDRAA